MCIGLLIKHLAVKRFGQIKNLVEWSRSNGQRVTLSHFFSICSQRDPKMLSVSLICDGFRDRHPLPVFKVDRSTGNLITLFPAIQSFLEAVIPNFICFSLSATVSKIGVEFQFTRQTKGNLIKLFSLYSPFQTGDPKNVSVLCLLRQFPRQASTSCVQGQRGSLLHFFTIYSLLEMITGGLKQVLKFNILNPVRLAEHTQFCIFSLGSLTLIKNTR